MVSREKEQTSFAKSFVGEMNDKSNLKKEKQIDLKTWRKGNHVICRKEKEVFEGEIVGFYEHSAVVNNLYTGETTNVNFRNLLEPETYKPLKLTDKEHALSTGGKFITAYIPTAKQKEKWLGDVLEGKPQAIKDERLLNIHKQNKKMNGFAL